MDHFLWPFIYFLFPLSSLASRPSMVSLAPSLIARIPPCAQACVESFISEELPVSLCPPLKDLECLCANNSASGLTLGEGSIRCVASSCADRDLGSDYMVYEICAGIKGAVSMTHKTLTATQPAPPSTSVRKTTHTSESSISNSLSTTKPSFSTVTSSISTSFSRSFKTNSTASNTDTSTTPPVILPTRSHSSGATVDSTTSTVATSSGSASAALASANKSLTKPQIAGIAVVGVVGVAIAIGVIFLICCVRRKRSKKRLSGSSFGGDRIIDSFPNTPGHSNARNRGTEHAHRSRDLVIVDGQRGPITPNGNNGSQTSLLGRNFHPDEIGVAVVPEMRENSRAEETPSSAASYRTTSKLLPDKPSYYSLYPSPLRIKSMNCQKNLAASPLLGEAEVGVGQTSLIPSSPPSPRARDASQKQPRHGYSPLRPSASDPFLDSRSDLHPGMYANERRKPLRLETTSNERSNPEVRNQAIWTRSLDNLHKPVPARQSSSARGLNQQMNTYASISPSEYTGRPLFDPLGAIQSQPRKPVPTRNRRSIQRRPSTRYSNASDTSFETAGDEDETPPLPVIHPILSPVQESPALHSSRNQVAYPGFSNLAASRRFDNLPELESPTRRPMHRKQPQPAPLITQNLTQKKPKGILKPLPNVPEHPDGSVDAFSPQQRVQTSTTIATDSDRDSDDVRRTAKWKILVSPGLDRVDTGTPKSRKSVEWAPEPQTSRTPLTPTRRGDIRIRGPLSPTGKYVRYWWSHIYVSIRLFRMHRPWRLLCRTYDTITAFYVGNRGKNSFSIALESSITKKRGMGIYICIAKRCMYGAVTFFWVTWSYGYACS